MKEFLTHPFSLLGFLVLGASITLLCPGCSGPTLPEQAIAECQEKGGIPRYVDLPFMTLYTCIDKDMINKE